MTRVGYLVLVLGACGSPRGSGGTDDARVADGAPSDGRVEYADAAAGPDAPLLADAASTLDAPSSGVDAGVLIDAPSSAVDAMPLPDAAVGVISGGPCMSGAAGATAYRFRFAGNGSGSTAYVVREANGLPSKVRDKAAAYGYQIGYTPQFVDPFLGQGGLRLDGSSFIDIELTTAGIAQIQNATIAIYGRSFNTTASGSFHWQTFDGTGTTPTNFVSNAAPYAWYPATMTTEIEAGDTGVLIRLKAGPASGSLVVHRVELCMQAS
ncbi:MAG: hypothetical protein M3680_33175 [Myxococcota bacterium]|nr:hypothetical protein [Myxococcota bacterium]